MSVLDAKPNTTIAFTDGACKGNPGAGGWGTYLVFADGHTQAWCGGADATTNNRMELMGAIQALENSPRDIPLEIWTDSSYVKNGITQWIDNWKQKGWKTASKKPVANQDLWQQLDDLRQSRSVSWHWVKGHAGHAGNEKADELANLGVDRVLQGFTEAFESETQNQVKKNLTDSDVTLTPTHSISAPSTDANPVVDDWLYTDPLGLDELAADELAELADDSLDEYCLDEYSKDTHYNDQAIDDPSPDSSLTSSPLASLVAANQHTNQSANPPTNQLNSDTMTSANSATTHTTTFDPSLAASTTDTDAASITNVTSEIKFDGDTSRANPYFVPLLPEPKHRHEAARQLIMDTETTGLDASQGDRIIEVGIVELVGRKFTGEKLHVYINPERSMDEDAIRIHGISEAFLQDKPKFAQVAQKLFDFMQGAELIAHNAPFDMGFLTMEFDKVGLQGFADCVSVTDSLVIAKQQYPGQRNTLDALVKRLNVGKQDRTFHGALLDAEILAEVYLAMTGGQVALAIDEDTQSDGSGVSHHDFAHLASKLVAGPTDMDAHQAWFEGLREQYPELNQVWGS